jgi:hypothetical protein
LAVDDGTRGKDAEGDNAAEAGCGACSDGRVGAGDADGIAIRAGVGIGAGALAGIGAGFIDSKGLIL